LQTLKKWIPYLLIWLTNVVWLAYFYTIGGYESYDVEVVEQPLTIVRIISTTLEAIGKAGFYVWGQVLVLVSKAITAPTNLVTLGLILFAFILILIYFIKLGPSDGEPRT